MKKYIIFLSYLQANIILASWYKQYTFN